MVIILIVKFKELFPDYKYYSNEEYLMSTVSKELLRAISQTLPRRLYAIRKTKPGLNVDGTLKNMCDIVSLHTNSRNTNNWGYDYLTRDFINLFEEFEDIHFHKFMDAVLELSNMDEIFLNELNEIFEDHDFGYKLTGDSNKPWVTVNSNIGLATNITDVIISTEQISRQTADHIRQAQKQLVRAGELRARKDAIRDCLSAMESLMTHLTGTIDIDNADRLMRENPEKWGQSFIVKDGIILWNMFHNRYKDIRHGNFNISEISYDEAIYFIDKLLAYVKYISSRAQENKTENENLPF